MCEYVVEAMVQKGSLKDTITGGAAACIVLLRGHEVTASCKWENDANFETGHPVGGWHLVTSGLMETRKDAELSMKASEMSERPMRQAGIVVRERQGKKKAGSGTRGRRDTRGGKHHRLRRISRCRRAVGCLWDVSLYLLEWRRVQQRGYHERDERRRKEEVSSSGLRVGRFVCNMRELQPKGENKLSCVRELCASNSCNN